MIALIDRILDERIDITSVGNYFGQTRSFFGSGPLQADQVSFETSVLVTRLPRGARGLQDTHFPIQDKGLLRPL